MMIPGVGLSPSGISLIRTPKKFFLPVKTLAKVFRARFLTSLKSLYSEGKLTSDINSASFQALIEKLFQVDWVVYTKKPFTSTWHLIRYLSNYTNKVAISNSRLISIDNGVVKFKYKDYIDSNQKVMDLDAKEFLRRFFMHVLPSRFVRIRHYGLLSNACRNKKLVTVKTLLGSRYQKKLIDMVLLEMETLKYSNRKCSCCGGTLKPVATTWKSTG